MYIILPHFIRTFHKKLTHNFYQGLNEDFLEDDEAEEDLPFIVKQFADFAVIFSH